MKKIPKNYRINEFILSESNKICKKYDLSMTALIEYSLLQQVTTLENYNVNDLALELKTMTELLNRKLEKIEVNK